MITHFREILVMPIRRPDLEPAVRPGSRNREKGHGPKDWAASIKQGESPWRDLHPPVDDAKRAEYAGFLYFHPFVRGYLFPKVEGTNEWVPRVLERTDVKQVKIEIDCSPADGPAQSSTIRLAVNQVRLWLFSGGVGLLVVEVTLPGDHAGLTLSETQTLLDAFRRAYKPYFQADKKCLSRDLPGHCPLSVSWLDDNGKELRCNAKSDYEQRHAAFARVFNERVAPLSSHWRWLLFPLRYESEATGNCPNADSVDADLAYSQFGDDRTPVMAFLAVDNVRKLTRGDFIRLCECDEKGPSRTLPYSTAFLDRFEKEHFYDRFWDPVTPRHDGMTTRYLASPHSFVVVGDAKCGYFTDEENGIQAHFGHHYFKLFLAAQMQKASLIAFAWRLADLATQLPVRRPREPVSAFHANLELLQREFSIFISRFWFDEVSPQVQGRELYALISRQIGLKALYDEVKDEIRFVAEAVSGIEQHQQTEKSVGLAFLANRAVPAALVTSALGMNVCVGILKPYVQEHVEKLGPLLLGSQIWSQANTDLVTEFTILIVVVVLVFVVWKWVTRGLLTEKGGEV